MNGQGTLWGEPARARRTDPESSQIAACEVALSGRAEAQAEIALRAVRRWPGFTSAELATRCSLNRYQIARRLPELERRGLLEKGRIRQCRASCRAAVTWWPVKE